MFKVGIKNIGQKPIRMWIDGRCFNLKYFKRTRGKTSKLVTIKGEENEDELEMHHIDFDIDKDGTLYTSFELPPLYYTKLKHNNFFDLNTLTNKTRTTISLPNIGKNDKIIIAGEENNIRDALRELLSVLGYIRDLSTPQQFSAIPLASEEIKSNFVHFKNEILKDSSIRGLEDSIFQSPLKLHLTINVFVLLNDKEKKEAVLALEEYNKNVLKPLRQKMGNLKIHIAGIECMNEDYEKVHVLYANAKIVNETEEVNLQDFANQLSEHFYEKGLLKKYEEQVKLHMTLINTKYRKVPGNPNKKWMKRKSFDASKIMEKYRNYDFGQCELNTIHISNMSSQGEDGFYVPLTTIKF